MPVQSLSQRADCLSRLSYPFVAFIPFNLPRENGELLSSVCILVIILHIDIPKRVSKWRRAMQNNNITKKLVSHDTDIGAVLNDEWVDGCVFFSVVVRIKV